MTLSSMELLHQFRRLLRSSRRKYDDKKDDDDNAKQGDRLLSSLKKLLDDFYESTTTAPILPVPTKGLHLLHEACHLQAPLEVMEYLVRRLPCTCLEERNELGWIPLHCALLYHHYAEQDNHNNEEHNDDNRHDYTHSQWLRRVIPLLVNAHPATVLLRIPHSNDNNNNNNNMMDSDHTTTTGILPSILAHNHPELFSPTVQYLLQIQLQQDEGLVLHHDDLAMLVWNEATYWDQVLQAIGSTNQQQQQPTPWKRICLDHCRLSSATWQALQRALVHRLQWTNTLERCSLVHVHIWNNHHHHHHDPSWHDNNNNNNNSIRPTLLHTVVGDHGATLQHLQWVVHHGGGHSDNHHHHWNDLHWIVERLHAQLLPSLTTLEYHNRTSTNHHHHHPTNGMVLLPRVMINRLASALRHPDTALINLTLPPHAVSIWGAHTLLMSLRDNATLQTLDMPILDNHNAVVEPEAEEQDWNHTKDDMVLPNDHMLTLEDLRVTLLDTLRGHEDKDDPHRHHHGNTTLHTIHLGPPLVDDCPQVQFYLQLNREYDRRHVGHWSAALMPHVLGNIHARMASNRGQEEEEDSLERNTDRTFHSSSSVLYYMLLTRPDIVIQQGHQQL